MDWKTGEFYPVRNTSELWDFGDYNYDIYNTEIARRGSWLGQDIYKVHEDTSKAELRPARPADLEAGPDEPGRPRRRHVAADRPSEERNWTLTSDGNPYAFRNMVCTNWAFEDGSNPYYPGGLCLDSAINLSAVIPDTCQDSETGA